MMKNKTCPRTLLRDLHRFVKLNLLYSSFLLGKAFQESRSKGFGLFRGVGLMLVITELELRSTLFPTLRFIMPVCNKAFSLTKNPCINICNTTSNRTFQYLFCDRLKKLLKYLSDDKQDENLYPVFSQEVRDS